MAAIFGVLGKYSEAECQEMGRRLTHRGRACYISQFSDQMFLGAVSNEPTNSIHETDGMSIVCDATLYNISELISRLQGRGIHVESNMPGKLILLIYRTFGPSGIEAIDGDFCFVLIDHRRGEVIFGRDFFGCAPLYYTLIDSDGLAFASEYKALLALSAVRPEVDLDMVQYLQYAKKLPVGRTLLSNVHSIQPGGSVRIDRKGKELERFTFTPLEVEAKVSSEEEAIELVRFVLTKALRRRSKDLDRIGLALSGGIDSIGMAFLFRKIFPNKEIYTYTAGYGPDDPEMATAALVAKHINSVHHEIMTPSSLLKKSLRKLVWHLEDPFARSEALQLMELGQIARDNVSVLFTGLGSDSLFGGAPKYMILWLMKWLPPLRKGLSEFYNLTQYSLKPISLSGRALDLLYFRGKVPNVPKVLGSTLLPKSVPLPPVTKEFINKNMAHGFQFGLFNMLIKFERGFAASGLSCRSPFSDLDLVRAAYTITDTLKIRKGVQKYILRKAIASAVPIEFQNILKFPQRMRYDVDFSKTLDGVCDELLNKEAVEHRGLFDYENIKKLRDRPSDKPYSPEAAMRIWTAILTELWAQEFLDKLGRGYQM